MKILKRYLFLLIPLLFSGAFFLKSFHVLARVQPADLTIPALCYHRITVKPASPYDFTPSQLESHFKYLKQHGYQPITATQFLAFQREPGLFPEKPVLLTFDDGSKTHYTRVLPLLKRYGFKATFFVFPNAVAATSQKFLTWSELREIAHAGMDIGSHSMSHPFLTKRNHLSAQRYHNWLKYELSDSKKVLEKKLNCRINFLAYPFGWFNSEIETAAVEAGYQGIFTVNWGPNQVEENPLRVKRRVMENSMSLAELENILTAKVLDLEILSPLDTAIVDILPEIRFRVKNPGIKTVKLEIWKYKAYLTADNQGVFSFKIPGKLHTGFIMIIVRGTDLNQNQYLNSWCFDYEPIRKQK